MTAIVKTRTARSLRLWSAIIGLFTLPACAPSLYQTHLAPEERAMICGYSEPSERENCLAEADAQIEWCKEALGQEQDCWNTLLGDLAHKIRRHPVSNVDYFAYLHDPLKLRSLISSLRAQPLKSPPLPL